MLIAALSSVLVACGSHRSPAAPAIPGPTAPRILPLSRVVALETLGPPPSDTSVSFPVGAARVIVLRHGPPDNIVFATLSFPANAFAESGQTVTVDVRPRPGVYGLDLAISLPLKAGAQLEFSYARYFSAPARARQIYRTDAAYERALSIGRSLPDNQIELLSSTRPTPDHLMATIGAPGSYLVAAPQ